jgi:hypothetical protein
MGDERKLLIVKMVHTVAWAFFAGCIVAVPFAGVRDQLWLATALCAAVFVEVLILSVNEWHCPLTPVAAQFTPNRRPNFDIFLPEWLARYNKEIFGTLYVADLAYLAYLWLR